MANFIKVKVAIKQLAISRATFYRWTKQLGIKRYKRPGSHSSFVEKNDFALLKKYIPKKDRNVK